MTRPNPPQTAADEANRLASTITPHPFISQRQKAIVALWPLPATGPEDGPQIAEALRRAIPTTAGVSSGTVAASELTDSKFPEA